MRIASVAMRTARVDASTAAYFEHHAPEYSPRRLRTAMRLINKLAPADGALIDVGCGVGNVLAYAAGKTRLPRLVGMDVSPRCLEMARDRVNAEFVQASILDADAVERMRGRFDVALMAAVLHHVIDGTRRRSRGAAERAVTNAAALIRPGGHLVIVEPTFRPAPPLTALFWMKRLTSAVVERRIPIGGYWNNIGPPVVSYYSHADVLAMVAGVPGIRVVDQVAEPQRLSPLAARVLAKTNSTIVAQVGTPS